MSETPVVPVPPVEYPVAQAPALGDHYIEIPEFTCDFPGCDVKKDTQRKLNAHKGQAHKRHAVKKKAAKVAPTVVDEEKPSKPTIGTSRGLKEVWSNGTGPVLMTDRDGNWWVAKKVYDVV